MFYLETKDGDKFFTDPKSDDVEEFKRILEQKLGQQAADFFTQLIEDVEISNKSKVISDLEDAIDQLRFIRDTLE